MRTLLWSSVASLLVASTLPAQTRTTAERVGYDDSELQAVMVDHEAFGATWRQKDYDVMNSPEFKKALRDNRVILVTWKKLQKLAQQP